MKEIPVYKKRNIKLRKMIESDIDDYIRWWTVETEWMDFDAPWEEKVPINIEEERKEWTKYFNDIKDLPFDKISKLEIEVDGKHVGWVCSYYDLEYIENKDNIIAIGIDIPEKSEWGKKIGTEALIKYMDILFIFGHKEMFIQTWSGNTRMIKVIENLCFEEFARKKDYRIVNGKKYDAITYKFSY